MARVGEPKLTYLENKKAESGKKPKKYMRLEIPVTEGDQFQVGEIKFEGLTVFKEEWARTLFKLEPGDVYNDSRIKKGYDKLRDVYGGQGYFQWTGSTEAAGPTSRRRSWTSPSPWTRTSATTWARSTSRATTPPATR